MFKSFCASALLMFSANAIAADYLIKKSSDNKITWTAVGNPGFLRINGKAGWVEGTAVDTGGMLSGDFSVILDSFDTGMNLRNEHMRDKYLETKKYPKATFKLDSFKMSDTPTAFSGDLTLKGATKKINGKMSVKSKKVMATFMVNLGDFPIGVPSWKEISMAKEVEVTVEFPLGG
jgi:polyisoprenoid-binding protein YceI